MSRVTVKSAVVRGIEAVPVDVEVSVEKGIQGFHTVGMVDAEVLEGKERVRAAIREAGFEMPDGRVLVNLAPWSIKKQGSGFDLAIAVGILAASGQIAPDMAGKLYMGELGLDGKVRTVTGALVVADYAKRQGVEAVFSAQTGDIDPSAFEGIAYGLRNLADLRRTTGAFCQLGMQHRVDQDQRDYSEIPGNAQAKRACQIAAAGGHPILFVGDPAASYWLACRIQTIMPAMSEHEKAARDLIWSVGPGGFAQGAGTRPLRAPHHSVTTPGLIGGGNPVRPGEVTLAHGGVLVLEDIAEFRPATLQHLRQVVEEKRVRIARADGTVEYPADFILAATAKPCPCGKLGNPEAECTCPVHHVLQYRDRLCGPLADKFQLRADVPAPSQIFDGQTASSAELREGVEAAREFAAARADRDGETGFLPSLHLDENAGRFVERCAEERALSGTAIHHSLAVARTIADLAQSDHVTKEHVAEALSFGMH